MLLFMPCFNILALSTNPDYFLSKIMFLRSISQTS